MPNILQLLKRRRINCAKVNSHGVITVDLTEDEDIECREDSTEVGDVPSERILCTEESTTPVIENIVHIQCPVCQLNISELEISQRESHVELCLLSPSRSSYIYKPSQKKPRKSKQIQKPKEPNKPKSSSEDRPKRPKKPKKPLPDFKIVDLPPHKVIVDGFCYADGPSDQYFLSHFHSDHYIGLAKSWGQGTIYTSEITAALLMKYIRVPEERIVSIPMQERYQVREGLWVTLEDANHCPGAVVFLFESDHEGQTKRVLHTGDFRVSRTLIDRFKDIYLDEIFLDTTYLNPQYTFYDQRVVITTTASFLQKCIAKKKPGILDYVKGVTEFVILIGSYTIGKEKIYTEIAKTLDTKIFVPPKRYETLSLSGMNMDLFEQKDESKCMIHVVPFQKLVDKPWLKRFSNKNIIVIRPTGWTFTRMGKSSGPQCEKPRHRYVDTVMKVFSQRSQTDSLFEEQLKKQWEKGHVLQVPYSEHSSFKELSLFGTISQWGQMIPTVSVDNPEFPMWFKAWKECKVDYSVVESHFTL
jgi:DNA cross-link repair 1A protein